MNTNEPATIKYARVSQKQGRVENLPILASAEFGFAQDTSQLFIGCDPALSTSVEHEAVSVVPFLNAKDVVQGYLDDSTDYNTLRVDDDLKIRVDQQSTAMALANYINTVHNENVSTGRKAIAFIDTNIEVVTSKNVHHYAQPREFVVNYSNTERVNTFGDKSYFKVLSNEDGDVFYQLAFSGALYVNIEYMLIQDDGRHVRSGNLKVIADTETENGTIASMTDDRNDLKSIPGGVTNANKIEFSVEGNGGVLYVKFTQPEDIKTKVFYRVSRWHAEDYSQISTFDTDSYVGPLK